VGGTLAQDAVESKKRETILVGLKQTKGQVGLLEESLMRVQLELERVSFSLQAKSGEETLTSSIPQTSTHAD